MYLTSFLSFLSLFNAAPDGHLYYKIGKNQKEELTEEVRMIFKR